MLVKAIPRTPYRFIVEHWTSCAVWCARTNTIRGGRWRSHCCCGDWRTPGTAPRNVGQKHLPSLRCSSHRTDWEPSSFDGWKCFKIEFALTQSTLERGRQAISAKHWFKQTLHG